MGILHRSESVTALILVNEKNCLSKKLFETLLLACMEFRVNFPDEFMEKMLETADLDNL